MPFTRFSNPRRQSHCQRIAQIDEAAGGHIVQMKVGAEYFVG